MKKNIPYSLWSPLKNPSAITISASIFFIRLYNPFVMGKDIHLLDIPSFSPKIILFSPSKQIALTPMASCIFRQIRSDTRFLENSI